jgi:NDP-sugar pyrophosphorylase family protein
MDNNPFLYTNFFNKTGIFSGLFEKFTYPWEALADIDNFISEFKESENANNFTQIQENIYVGKNVTIDDTARITGGAIIGNNCTIGHAAFIRAGVLLGDNVHVGHATEVKHSIILENTALAHLNYIGDSIVGSDCNISGGATLANWRFDKKEIEIKNVDKKIQTHLEKMGSIIGDGCFVGVSAVINPGTVMARNSLVFPLISVKGTYFEPLTFK